MKPLYLLYLSQVNQTVSIEEFEALKRENAMLRHELEQLKKLIFGSKNERFVPAQRPEQLSLGFDGTPAVQEAEAATEKISYTREKRAHPGRTPLPDNLPTDDIIIEPQEDTRDMVLIGEEITETIDYKPGVLIKRIQPTNYTSFGACNFQRCGSNSSTRFMGWSPMRSRMSFSQS